MIQSVSHVGWLALTWPLGFGLVLGSEVGIPTLLIALLVLAYLGLVLGLVRGRAVAAPWAVGLVLTPSVLFALAAFTGAPTAAEPSRMLLNTVALLIVAIGLLVLATQIVHGTGARAAPTGVVLLATGTALYLVNLFARVAIVLSGAAPLQADRENTAWVAYEYLLGLEQPDPMSLLLIWTDLLQLAYVVTAHVCFGLIAYLLARRAVVPARWGRALGTVSLALAAAVTGGALLAITAPAGVDRIAAWMAYIASIPFMTTLVPWALGIAWLQHAARTDETHRSKVAVS